MKSSRYSELEKLIKEHDEDQRTINQSRIIMINFPKVFTMSSASLFEFNIKKKCQKFIDSPKFPILTQYPKIQKLIDNKKNKKPIVDQLFAKLEGYDDDGVETLNAEKFYDFFGGKTFKDIVESKFTELIKSEVSYLNGKIKSLSYLVGQDEKYDLDYTIQTELMEEIRNRNFDDAEKAYLKLKLRRNRVAHDYMNGLSDTFADLQKFYNIAVLYVMALEDAITSITNDST